MWRKKRVWSAASMRLSPQTAVTGVNRCMPARRASRRSPRAPTIPRTAEAAALSERRIIGPSRRRSAARSRRCRTSWRRRYATSSIGFSTLADGNVRREPRPQRWPGVRTANAMMPWRCRAYASAWWMCGFHPGGERNSDAAATSAAADIALGDPDAALREHGPAAARVDHAGRVRDHPVEEAPVQAGDVDPLLVVRGGVDVRPPDRRAERDALRVQVLVAAGVVRRRRRPRAPVRVLEVAQAVVLLRAHPDTLQRLPVGVGRPQLEAKRMQELPVAVLAGNRLEPEPRAGLDRDVAATRLVDPLDRDHAVGP